MVNPWNVSHASIVLAYSYNPPNDGATWPPTLKKKPWANTMTAAGIRVNGFDGRTGSTIARACIDGILLYGAEVYLPCKSALKRMEQIRTNLAKRILGINRTAPNALALRELGWPTLHQIWRAKRAKFLWKTAATSKWNTFHGAWFFSCILHRGSWWKETLNILGERLAHMCLHDVPWISIRDELQRMNRSEDSRTLSPTKDAGPNGPTKPHGILTVAMASTGPSSHAFALVPSPWPATTTTSALPRTQHAKCVTSLLKMNNTS
ncbi:hypothetical protein QOT17_019438 [Balamuthia mandrillaris]